MSKPTQMMIVGTDGEEHQEFEVYPGIILNVSPKEWGNYWRRFGRFGLSPLEIILLDFKDGSSEATVHTFAGHKAISMKLVRLQNKLLVVKMIPTFRVS